MKEGNFREDFYFRLAVVEITVPPLRERGEDIEFLATSFLKRYSVEANSPNLKFGAATLKAIRSYGWTGNVRELQNRVRRAAIMCEGNTVSAADLQISASSGKFASGTTLKEARETIEKEMVQSALAKHKGKITAAAAELGVSRPTFYELMDKLGIKR